MADPIVVVGSINMDLVATTKRLPLPGETVLGGTFMQARGGKGANQAVAAARSESDVIVIGSVGNDGYGEACRSAFNVEGVDTRFVRADQHHATGVALITVDSDGQNCIVVAPGANTSLSAQVIDVVLSELPTASVCLCQLETPLDGVQAALSWGKSNGAFTILNPAPARPLEDALLAEVSCLTPNESEAELLTGIRPDSPETARQAAEALLERGVQVVVITLGAQGALLVDHEGAHHQPAPKVTAVDTTAAGDTFTGCLAASVAQGEDVRSALAYACAGASLSVTRVGAQPSIPSRAEIDLFMRNTSGKSN
jgi:ribokinase